MYHLCGWLKLFLKKCSGKKIKKHLVGLRVSLLAVQLQYGLYILDHPSKLAFHFMYKVVCLVVVVSSVRLACNGSLSKNQILLLENSIVEIFCVHLPEYFILH